ncbi:MAG: hypothetical protein LBR50_09915 [Tannerella sp.]|jgi:hypothetical protein|nr:hypothetical protein [Tannerella sp.]
MVYKFTTQVSDTGVLTLPFMYEFLNQPVEVIVQPIGKYRHRNIEERLSDFRSQYGNTFEASEEIDWGKPIGEEVW